MQNSKKTPLFDWSRKNFALFFCAGLLATATSGCTTIRKDIKPDALGPLGLSNTFKYSVASVSEASHYLKAYDRAEPAAKKARRNEILFELLSIVDADFSRFSVALRGDRTFKDLTFKVVSLGLTGVASVASSGAAHTLAAIDTGFKGASEAIDATAFRNHTTEILINKMEADRATIRAEIYEGMKGEADKYSLQSGIYDIERYYLKGSVTSALATLSASTAAESKASDAIASEVQGGDALKAVRQRYQVTK